jgi:hypothetical protein
MQQLCSKNKVMWNEITYIRHNFPFSPPPQATQYSVPPLLISHITMSGLNWNQCKLVECIEMKLCLLTFHIMRNMYIMMAVVWSISFGVISVSDILYGVKQPQTWSAHSLTLHFECWSFVVVSLLCTEYMGHCTSFPSVAQCSLFWT